MENEQNQSTGQSIGIKVVLPLDYEAALTHTIEALKTEGFGVLTEIDVKETMKKKLGIEYSPYKILGACNPTLANRALQIAPEIGLLLPCNVTVRLLDHGQCEISLVDPLVMLGVIASPLLAEVAHEAKTKLERVAALLQNH